jgi:hypothetical protein
VYGGIRKSANATATATNSTLSIASGWKWVDFQRHLSRPKICRDGRVAARCAPWFLGCQFHPEYKSKPLNAHRSLPLS